MKRKRFAILSLALIQSLFVSRICMYCAGSRSDFKICNIYCVLCYTKTFDKMQINRQEKKSLENYASRIEMPHTVHVCMSPLY